MIEYLKIEIVPARFANTDWSLGAFCKELRIKIKTDRKPLFEKRQICEPDDLTSFFEQIFECAKQEILQVLKES